MTLAEELSQKWGARTGGNSVEFLDRDFNNAIDAALERAAAQAESLIPASENDPFEAGKWFAAETIAKEIRVMKTRPTS